MGEKKCQYEISAQCLARAAKNTGYGPPSTCDFMRDVPYAPYSKSDQIRRCADWTVPQDASQPHRQDDFAGARRRRFGAQETFGSGTADTYTHAAEEEGSFSVVDRISSTLRKSTGFKPRNKQVRTPFAPGARGADKRGVPMRRRWNDKPQRYVFVLVDWLESVIRLLLLRTLGKSSRKSSSRVSISFTLKSKSQSTCMYSSSIPLHPILYTG
jgi:hypothetical protein